MEIKYLDIEQIHSILPDRIPETHKGDYGKLLLLCGSKGYTGAAALAAMGALRCGAGLVYLAVPECIYPITASKLLEPVVLPMPDDDSSFHKDTVNHIKMLLERVDCVLIGPGIGCSEGTLELLAFVISHYSGTVVIDADGINLLATHKNILRDRTCRIIITPHEGEFARICDYLPLGRINAAISLSKEYGIITVLKGHETVITDGTDCYINKTGNPGMAVGGCGDVLAGIITALVGQKVEPLTAAACGVWLHGAAGDICAKEIGQYGMLPSDMLHVLPRLLK